MNIDKIFTKPLQSGDHMHAPEIIEKILNLSALGLGKKRIAKLLGINPKTVQRYVRQGIWRPYQRTKGPNKLASVRKWVEEAFQRHKGNSAVVH